MQGRRSRTASSFAVSLRELDDESAALERNLDRGASGYGYFRRTDAREARESDSQDPNCPLKIENREAFSVCVIEVGIARPVRGGWTSPGRRRQIQIGRAEFSQESRPFMQLADTHTERRDDRVFRIDLDGFGPVEHVPPDVCRGLQQREDVVGRESWRESEIHSDIAVFLAMVENRAKRIHLHRQRPERSPAFAGVAECPKSLD